MGRSVGKFDPSDFPSATWAAFTFLAINRKGAFEIATFAIYIYVEIIERCATNRERLGHN
jgi:hypothetical protein